MYIRLEYRPMMSALTVRDGSGERGRQGGREKEGGGRGGVYSKVIEPQPKLLVDLCDLTLRFHWILIFMTNRGITVSIIIFFPRIPTGVTHRQTGFWVHIDRQDRDAYL